MSHVDIEREMQRRQTKAFIDADPVSIILNRAELVSNDAGGFRQNPPSPRLPQTVRLIAPREGDVERQMLDGQMVQVDWIVLFEHDGDVKRGDWFYQNSVKYEVVSVRSVSGYEIKAEVTNRG